MRRYRVYLLPRAVKEIDSVPGNMRQRVRRAVTGLRDDPYPTHSRRLAHDVGPGRELWRLRFDAWRVVYLLEREFDAVYVLAVRRRPPYQYEDLSDLLVERE